MPTHGAARQKTIAALAQREVINRPGFAMKTIQGPSSSLGRLEGEWRKKYQDAHYAGRISYTVMSYSTPILWVERNTEGTEEIVCPNVGYSNTTRGHLHLAKVYVTV